jgi:predicted permease
VFNRKRLPSDFNAEVEAHIQLETERLREQGLSEQDARAAAHRAFGNRTQAEERFYESHRWLFWDHLRQDLRFGIRMLSRNPGFAAVAVLTLSLGIAVNATIFSMVSAFLLRRPPGHDPEHVVVVSSVNPSPVFLPEASPVSPPNYLAWRERTDIFSEMAAADDGRSVTLTGQFQPEALASSSVTPNYFHVLAVEPQLGRTFAAGEDQPGRNHVLILSHELWQRRFAGDPSVVGTTVRVNREDYTIIGVMPASFRLLGFLPQLWTPLTLSEKDKTTEARNDRSLYLFARLQPGITLNQAKSQLATLARNTASEFPDLEKGWGATLRTLPDFLIYNFNINIALGILMTAVAFVLLIACANVAGLMLARASGRRKELAIRLSLGASRIRTVRQLLTESLVIAMAGGALGLVMAYGGIAFVRMHFSFNEVFRVVPVSLDRNVLSFAVAVSVLSALLCGIAPALSASRTNINDNLKEEGRTASAGHSGARLRLVLVTGEIALALLLLIGTGLLIHAIVAVERQNMGFDPNHLLTSSVSLDRARYKDDDQRLHFVQNALEQLRHVPGASAVAVTSDLPATGASTVTVEVKGKSDLTQNQPPTTLRVVVSTDYFQTTGIPLLRGRMFTDLDTSSSPRVVLVNQTFAKRYLDQDPLGKQIRLKVSGFAPEWSEIVGVVANIKTFSEGTDEDPEVYESFLQRPIPSFFFMIRSPADPSSLAPVLRSTIAKLDPELPLARVMSMPAVIETQRGGNSLFLTILGTFGIFALLLAAVGIYGLIAFSVDQRSHEIGIRMALGAEHSDVLRMILWDGIKMAIWGAVIGFPLALALPRILDSLIYGFPFQEPRVYVVVPVTIFLVSLVATYIPARRAVAVNPLTSLRHS